jgi:hypothetical protein
MALLRLADQSRTTVLVDINIRAASDDPNDDARDVAKDLRDRLGRDTKNRPYLDAFLMTHPDADHIRGLQNHFWLGPSPLSLSYRTTQPPSRPQYRRYLTPCGLSAVGSGNAQMTISTITPRCRPLFRNSCRALMMV